VAPAVLGCGYHFQLYIKALRNPSSDENFKIKFSILISKDHSGPHKSYLKNVCFELQLRVDNSHANFANIRFIRQFIKAFAKKQKHELPNLS